MAITTQNGAYADPNTNMGRELTKEVRGDTYLTKEWSDGTGESTFGLPEWIPDDTGKYQPYLIMENPNTYVIENKYLPMSINKADCMTTLYLNNENILDGAETMMEKQYWEVYHKENETDNYQLLDTSTWDCETTFTSGNDFSIFTTWEKSHGYETLEPSQYDTTSTNVNGTISYFRTLSETTNNPTMSQQVITNSTGTFTVDVWTDNFTTTTENIPVIPSEIKSTFQVEYRYMLDKGEVESFTRIINNDVNLENHYFQFVNKFEGVNYDAFNLGDDIEFTDDSLVGTYYATAENVPEKYIGIAQQGYPLYYSLEKGEEWWTGAGATIYMDGAEKKLNVQVDFGKDREPLALNTMQELDPTFTATPSSHKSLYDTGNNDSCDGDTIGNTSTGSPAYVRTYNTVHSYDCIRAYFEYDTSSLPDSIIVTDSDFAYTVSGNSYGQYDCDIVGLTANQPSSSTDAQSWADINSGSVYVNDTDQCKSGTGDHDLGSTADTEIQNSSDWFAIAMKLDDEVQTGSIRGQEIATTPTLTVTYEIPTVTGAPTNLSATGTSTSQIDLSWTAPDTSSATIPAVSGYRIQSSDFAFANASLPTGRTADADVYGSITGGVDMDTANLYLSMNTTQTVYTSSSGNVDSSLAYTGGSSLSGFDYTVYQPVTLSGSNEITDVRIKISATGSGNAKVAVYDDDGSGTLPNTLLGSSASTTISGTGWQSIPLSSAIQTSETLVWVAVKFSTTSTTMYGASDKSGTSGDHGSVYCTHPTDPCKTFASDYPSTANVGNSGGTANRFGANSVAMGLVKTAISTDVILDESYRGNHATLHGHTPTKSNSNFGSWTTTGSQCTESSNVVSFDITTRTSTHICSQDLGSALSDDKWVLRGKLDYTTLTGGGGSTVYLEVGVGSSATATIHNDGVNLDFIGLQQRISSSDNGWGLVGYDSSGSLDNPESPEMDTDPNTSTTYYFEIKRTSNTAMSIGLYSDSGYSTTIMPVETKAVGTGVTDLRYLRISNGQVGSESSTGNVIEGTISDLKVWNDVSTTTTTANIQTNSIWEESDTGKHFLWTGSAWTEVA